MPARTGLGLAAGLAVVMILVLDAAWPAGFVYAAVCMAVAAVALSELAGMAARVGVPVNAPLLVLAGSALFLLQWAGWAAPDTFGGPWFAAGLVPAVAVGAGLAEHVLRGRIPGAIESVGVLALGLIYVPLLLGFLTGVRLRWGVSGLFAVLAVCKFGSSGAYFFGSWLGRRKLAPVVSPGKTVLGAFAEVGTGMLVALLLSLSPLAVLAPGPSLAFGMLVSGAAIVGDLAASLLKRQAGLKDSSPILPGIGGMLDMIDGLLFAAPVAYFVLAVCGAGG
ncbi:MAG: phosphatidate cytidylyltransferase [Candidatus Brocadiaceae bacterium]|nr:phosphatidate cytidylyltransferase [Candidatus Brocadiaceae bacterium]